MKAMHALFENGRVTFPFDYPDVSGPVAVVIVFPDDPLDRLEDESFWQEEEPEVPY